MSGIKEAAARLGIAALGAAVANNIPGAYRGMIAMHQAMHQVRQTAISLGCSDEYIERFDRAATEYAHSSTNENGTTIMRCYKLLLDRLTAGKEVEPIDLTEWEREYMIELVMMPHLMADTLREAMRRMSDV